VGGHLVGGALVHSYLGVAHVLVDGELQALLVQEAELDFVVVGQRVRAPLLDFDQTTVVIQNRQRLLRLLVRLLHDRLASFLPQVHLCLVHLGGYDDALPVTLPEVVENPELHLGGPKLVL